MRVGELFVRDVYKRVANEGVAKVWQRDALYEEISEYVLTDTIERNLRQFLGLFVESMDTRDSAQAIDAMATWCSGFFGSGKSHFVKILGHLLADGIVDEASGKQAIDVFKTRIPDDSRYKQDILGDLHQIATRAWCLPVFLEVRSVQNLINPNSITEICLSGFYRALGYSPNIKVARHEMFMLKHGFYEDFKKLYESESGTRWEDDRDDYAYYEDRVAEIVAECSADYDTPEKALTAFRKAEQDIHVDANTFASELLAYLDRKQQELPQQVPHIVFVLDELQQFIGENNDRIEEVRTIVETLGGKGKGRVWVVATGQEALAQIFDRAGLKLEGLGKLNARFAAHLMLGTEDVQQVVEDRLLRKRDAHRAHLEDIYDAHDGQLAELSRLNTSRTLPALDKDSFLLTYPFLPYQLYLAPQIFDGMRGTKLGSTPRSMLDVTQSILQQLADEPCEAGKGDVRLVSFDLIYDEIKDELYNDDFLGSHGIRQIDQADQAVPDCTVSPTRILKVLWLTQRLSWIPRTAACLARMLVTDISQNIATAESDVTETLDALRDAGYVGYDEGTSQYKYLSTEEGEVEKAIQDYMRKVGVGDTQRRCTELMTGEVLTRAKLRECRVPYGTTGTPFEYALEVEHEAVKGTLRQSSDLNGGSHDMLLSCYGPLSSVDEESFDTQNLASSAKGRFVWWIAKDLSGTMTNTLKRLIALETICADPNHTQGQSENYRKAVREKAEERDRLCDRLIREIDDALRAGKIYASGEVVELDGKSEIATIAQQVFKKVIPNIFTRFDPADKNFEPQKDTERFLDKAQSPHRVAPDLGLFDTDDQLIPSHELLGPITDCLRDWEAEVKDLDGASIETHFDAAPFGWQPDLIRTLLAALFRGGAVKVTAGRDFYDYTESDARETFIKPTKFRRAYFHAIKETLSPKQLAEARALLQTMGVKNVREVATDLAREIKRLSAKLLTTSQRATQTAEYSVPISPTHKGAEDICSGVAHMADPTTIVTHFLNHSDAYKQLYDFGLALEQFLGEKRDHEYLEIGKLLAICADNPAVIAGDSDNAIADALEDMQQVDRDCAIVERWDSYAHSAERLETAYRTVYSNAYEAVVDAAVKLRPEIEALPEYQELEPARRDVVMKPVFGPNGSLGLEPLPDHTSRKDLLQVHGRWPLVALQAIVTSMPTYRQQLVDAIHSQLDAQHAEAGEPVVKVKRVQITSTLLGTRLKNKTGIDAMLKGIRTKCADALKDGDEIEIQ